MNMRSAKCITQGYALCTPSGTLLGHTYRATADDAIRSIFSGGASRLSWAEGTEAGWSVEYVYARIFTPKFFVDVVPEERTGA